MKIKWSKTALNNLIAAIEYLEQKGYYKYAAKLESEILKTILDLPRTHLQHENDRFKFNPYYAVGIVGQQNFAIISSAHGLFWIERIASYFEIQNGSKCLRLKQNKVE